MSEQVNVEPTAKAIEDMAVELEAKAAELRGMAKRARETGDLSYAAEAAGVVMNIMGALRLDLLVRRPLRELGVK